MPGKREVLHNLKNKFFRIGKQQGLSSGEPMQGKKIDAYFATDRVENILISYIRDFNGKKGSYIY